MRKGLGRVQRKGRASAFRHLLLAILRIPGRFVQSIDDIELIHAMNLATLDLNLLVALDALLFEGHVGRAARKLGRSQPATSHAHAGMG